MEYNVIYNIIYYKVYNNNNIFIVFFKNVTWFHRQKRLRRREILYSGRSMWRTVLHWMMSITKYLQPSKSHKLFSW